MEGVALVYRNMEDIEGFFSAHTWCEKETVLFRSVKCFSEAGVNFSAPTSLSYQQRFIFPIPKFDVFSTQIPNIGGHKLVSATTLERR